jgi:hypothetical protein
MRNIYFQHIIILVHMLIAAVQRDAVYPGSADKHYSKAEMYHCKATSDHSDTDLSGDNKPV